MTRRKAVGRIASSISRISIVGGYWRNSSLVNFLMQTAKANNSAAQLFLTLFARAARDLELWGSTYLVRWKENHRTEFIFLVYYTLDDGFDKCVSWARKMKTNSFGLKKIVMNVIHWIQRNLTASLIFYS